MSKTKVVIELTLAPFKRLSQYLEMHEQDIAMNFDDYGDLYELFVQVFDREPNGADDGR